MKTKILLSIILGLYITSCVKIDIPRKIDYSKTKVTLLTDGNNRIETFENGESLLLQFEGLHPLAPVQAYLLDEKGNE